MLIYKGKVLTKFKDKKGGKNQSKMDGFYRDTEGQEFFIKKPKDPKELFTELLAGLLLQEFMRRGLIDPIYQSSLICAELILFEDGSYGLIQPKVSFKELYKIIGTGYRDGSDRDPLVEMFCGPEFYLLLTQLKQYYGLAIALMFSLLLGDNSVHSGNVVCLDVVSTIEMTFIQLARLDWGAAFRYFGHKKNNEDLLSPFEYQGWFNLKGYTKGYFLNYLKIKGLFPAIAQQARLFQQKVNGELLFDMICSVLSKLPADLVDNKTRIELANYLCMESFNNISFGEGGNYQQFARDLTDIFQERLKKITVMQDSSAATAQSDLSQIAYVESLPTAITLPVNMVTPFAEQMNVWLHMFFSSDEKSVFDFNGIDRSQLAHQFKYFMDGLLRQTERLKQGVVGCFTEPDGSITLPYSESNFLRCLFTLTTDLTPNLPSYKEERMPYKEAYWLCAEKVLESGFQVMVTIRVLQNTQNSTEVAKASAIHFLFDALKEYLKVFSDVYQVFLQELEKKLSSMSGVQLARICFSEMEFMNSSSLIGIVLKNPTLWSLMNKAFEEEDKMLYSENAPAIIKLRQFHEDFNLFLILARELELISQVESKGVLIKEISRIFANLPQFLQTELATTLNKVQGEFRELHRRHSLELEERKQGKEEFHISAEKSSPVTNHGDNLESAQLPTQKSSSEIETVDVQRHASNLFFFSLPDISKFLSSSNKFPAQKEELPSVIETKF